AERLDAAPFAGIRVERQQPQTAVALGCFAGDQRVWRNGAPDVWSEIMKPVFFSLLLCASLLAVALGLAGEQKEARWKPSVYAELGKAPEKARNRLNPLENDPEAAAAGRVLFLDHCAECHGENAEGAKKGPSLRAPEVQNAAPGAIFWI